MLNLGKKIVIVGVSASGKSTIARMLAVPLGLPLVHMDSIWWKPGWIEVSEREAAKRLETVTQGDEWVVEGYIPESARAPIFGRADTVIYLDYSSALTVWQYLKRWWKHRKTPRPELEGSPEKFDFGLFKTIWRKAEAVSLDESLNAVIDRSKIIRLTSSAQTKRFLQRLEILQQ